jgi:hypothetical protein
VSRHIELLAKRFLLASDELLYALKQCSDEYSGIKLDMTRRAEARFDSCGLYYRAAISAELDRN